MEHLGNIEIFVLVLKGTVAFYTIKYLFRGAAWIFFVANKRRLPSLTSTIDDIWHRQRDSNVLLEEMHAILTERVTAAELKSIRTAMDREGSDPRWVERLFFKNYMRRHLSPSELEDFLEDISHMPTTCDRKTVIAKYAEYRFENRHNESGSYPWEGLFMKADKVINNKEL